MFGAHHADHHHHHGGPPAGMLMHHRAHVDHHHGGPPPGMLMHHSKGLKKYFVNMDEFLSSLGLYRKMMARDASCLFRAVSEQLYYSQSYHQKIRRACANFMSANRANFEPFVEGSFEKYLERLVDPKETAGQVEIKALSQLYSRCFHIYRYPGKQPTVINEDDYQDKLMLCCSNNGHYDIVYPRSYPTTAALCQSLLYELLYTRVLGVEGAELQQALESFRVGGRRYRNSPSACSDGDPGEEWDSGGPTGSADDKARSPPLDKPLGDQGPPPPRLSLPYKVLKSLDGELYRNLEFDVWHESRKEMQKTDYMVFAGRQYFLGDKCQVRLEPKGKYYNAFIQEVGTHTSAVTVFIEELGEKHLVPLAHLKPVNPVPAWNVTTPTRKGDLEGEGRGQRQRHRYFRKSRGGGKGGGGGELVLIRPSSPSQVSPHPPVPPRFQPGGGRGGAMSYDPYAAPPHHHHHPQGPPHPQARSPRYGAPRSSVRFMNRHLIGPQLAYYHPGRRYYQGYHDNYSFRSRRTRRQVAINKDCQFGFHGNPGEAESHEQLEGSITYYHLDEGGEFPPMTGQAVAPGPPPPLMGPAPPPHGGPSYWLQREPLPSSPPKPHPPPVTSSEEEEPEDTSTLGDQAEYSEEYIYASQDADFQSPVVYSSNDPNNNLVIQEDSQTHYNYTQQVVKPTVVLPSSPSSSSSSSSSPTSPSSHLPPPAPRPVSMAMAPPSPWLVSEMGEAVATVMAPPPYSYDPNGSDLPRDYRILQYYFNLGVQWCHQNSWQQVYAAPPPPDAPYHYQAYPHYIGPAHSPQEVTIHATTQPGPPHPAPPPSPYLESTRAGGDGQTDGHANGHASLSLDCSASSPLSPSPPGLVYQEQPIGIATPLPYDPAPLPGPAYLAVNHPPPPHPHHHSSAYFLSGSPAHWGGGHTPRLYCPPPPAPGHAPSHVIGYIAGPPAPAHHHHHASAATHYMP